VRIIHEQPVPAVSDLVLDPADPAGDHGTPLPHRLGDGQPKALHEALLDDHGGVPLQRIHDDRVLVDVVHRDRGQVHADADRFRELVPVLGAVAEHLGALGVVGHARDVRPREHQVSAVQAVVGDRKDEALHHAGHVLEPIPPAHLEHQR
jgi:hypothetical protein